MARNRTRSRIGERSDYDEEVVEEEIVDDDDEVDDEDDDEEESEEEEEEEKPVKPVKKRATTTRKRTVKQVRMKMVWVIFDNANKPVAEFPFAQKAEAEAELEKRRTEKAKGNFFLLKQKVEIKE